ncbi:MAG: hypothetical protein SFU86_13460 [Pirellulaceae bacterium]|nr:hypothetical protein [Pirellulaceae bacterium]
MTDQLLAPTMLFRFAAPCHYAEGLAASKSITLSEKYRLPCFAELEGKPSYADVRLGWCETGLALLVRVAGKSQPPWCRDSKIEDSDGVQLWIDTRNTQNIHRAGRFCHRFVFLPCGSGRKLDEPVAALLAINRAKESPREIERGALVVQAAMTRDGYALTAFIPASALTGYSPADQPAMGFSYAVSDRERGMQTFTVGPELPFADDPSLWGTLEFAKK